MRADKEKDREAEKQNIRTARIEEEGKGPDKERLGFLPQVG